MEEEKGLVKKDKGKGGILGTSVVVKWEEKIVVVGGGGER